MFPIRVWGNLFINSVEKKNYKVDLIETALLGVKSKNNGVFMANMTQFQSTH